MGKGEIARNEQFLLYPQCFLLNQIIISTFFISLFAAELEEPKVGILAKGLNVMKRQNFFKASARVTHSSLI